MPELPKSPEDSTHVTLPPSHQGTFETQVPDNFSTLPVRVPAAPAESPAGSDTEPISTGVVSAWQPVAAVPDSTDEDQGFATQGPDSVALNDATEPIVGKGGGAPFSARAGQSDESPSVGPVATQVGRPLDSLPGPTEMPLATPGEYATIAPSLPDFRSRDADFGADNSFDSQAGSDTFGSLFAAKGARRFRIIREHAKGGLGRVFVAEDLELEREVAFKEIQARYADDHETQVRFLREAKITGGLEHPGIVPIYGLGLHANGRPYYAMRFIRGHSLQEAISNYHHPKETPSVAAARQLELRQLLRRFIDVCDALEYAHAQGILHRDLKPGNVMLGEYGETLVVDWGLAKSYVSPEPEQDQPLPEGPIADSSMSVTTPRARLARLSEDASLQTMIGTAVGTPQFMSPEQARGQEIEVGPASDIYSLGATLYTILTGTGAIPGNNSDEVIRNVIKGVFPSPQSKQPDIPNALNAICLKAMARFPGDRYHSARSLAADVEHWLDDETVEAYSETRRERLNRWIRKHQARAQAIGTAVIGIALVSIIAAVLIDQSRRAEATALKKLKAANDAEILAKHEALRRTRQTRDAVDTSLSGMSEALDAFPGMQDVRRRLLERAASDYQKLAEEKSDDHELQAEAARNLARLGDIRIKLNAFDLATQAYERSAQIFQRLSEQYPDVPDYVFEVAQTSIQQGVALAIQGQHSSADSQFREAAALLRPLVAKHPDSMEYRDSLATALIGSGRAKNAGGDPTGAEQLLSDGLHMFADLRREYPKNLRIAAAYTESMSAMSRFLLDRGRPNDAIKMLDDSLAIHDKIIAQNPAESMLHANRATARINQAEAVRSLGHWPLVARNYESAVDDYQDLVREQPDVPLYRENLAVARTNFGQSLRRLGKNTEAIPILEKALDSFSELGASFPLARYVEAAGNTRVSLALAFSELGKQAEAQPIIEAALADYSQLLQLEPESVPYQQASAIALSSQARIQARQGDMPGALTKFEAAIKTLQEAADKERATPRYRDNLAWAWTHLANVSYAANQLDRSKSAFQAAIEVRHDLEAVHDDAAQYQDSLAWLLATCPILELRDIPRALKLSLAATDSISESPQFHLTLAAAQYQNQKAAAALESLNTSRRQLGQDDGLTLYLRALCEAQLKREEDATKTLAAARTWRAVSKPTDEELARWDKLAEQSLETLKK